MAKGVTVGEVERRQFGAIGEASEEEGGEVVESGEVDGPRRQVAFSDGEFLDRELLEAGSGVGQEQGELPLLGVANLKGSKVERNGRSRSSEGRQRCWSCS